MLIGEEVYWKYFIVYFLRVLGMSFGKLIFVFDYRLWDIDNDILFFYKEFLIVWC